MHGVPVITCSTQTEKCWNPDWKE